MSKIQQLKNSLTGLNYTQINKNTSKDELQQIAHEIDKFLSQEYRTNIDDFAEGRTNLTADQIKEIKVVFDAKYCQKLKALQRGEEPDNPNKTQLKLTGCRCEYRPKELGGEGKVFEIDLGDEPYDPNQDLVACPQCQRQDKYSQFNKKDFSANEVNGSNQLPLTIIYGAKKEDDPQTLKCADCQQEKKPNELQTIQDNGRDIKICSDCKQKRDNPDDPNKNPHPDNIKKWGKDFGQLKPGQRQGRVKTQNSWGQKKAISFLCLYCQKKFPFDKSMENYLEAREKARNELNTHKNSCPLKNSEEAKKKLQTWWEGAIKSKTRVIKTCEKCWGKILWDKKIKDVETARQQALSDWKYHQDKECGTEGKKKIAIYHSPNSGGNEHAPINNSLTDDGIYHQDNEGEVYQEQGNKDKEKPVWPWIVGGVGIIAVIGFIIILAKPKRRKKKSI